MAAILDCKMNKFLWRLFWQLSDTEVPHGKRLARMLASLLLLESSKMADTPFKKKRKTFMVAILDCKMGSFSCGGCLQNRTSMT